MNPIALLLIASGVLLAFLPEKRKENNDGKGSDNRNRSSSKHRTNQSRAVSEQHYGEGVKNEISTDTKTISSSDGGNGGSGDDFESDPAVEESTELQKLERIKENDDA